jgi:hypothetical protein
MALDTEDKKWICKVLAVCVRIVVNALVGTYKTQIAVDGAKRIEQLYLTDIGDRYDEEGYRVKEK